MMNRKDRKQWEEFLPTPGTSVTLIINKGLSVEEKRQLFYHGFIGDYKPEMVRFTETFDPNQTDLDSVILLRYSDISEWQY
jgi:hypothetical protein